MKWIMPADIVKIMPWLSVLAWLGCPAVPRAQHVIMSDAPGTTLPIDWIDADTGHRVVRLSRGPGQYRSFYFHNNPFFKNDDGDDMMVINGSALDDTTAWRPTTQQYWMRPTSNAIYTINLRTGEMIHLAGAPRSEIIGRTSRTAYCQTSDRSTIIGIDLMTGAARTIATLPEGQDPIRLSTLNADETLMAGTIIEDPWPEGVPRGETKASRIQATFDAKQMRRLVVFDLRTAQYRTLLREPNWFNHHQYSPTDPAMLMYCHEGPWHLLDRIWTIPVDGSASAGRRMLDRTVDMEIWGHEWWDPTGDIIWCDHQIPRGKKFFVTGIDIKTLAHKSYELTRNEWSVHFTLSPDRTIFAGDGGSPGMVARAPDGQWIYLFRPNDETMRFESEKLVNMNDHDYSLEPNVHFTPDQKWVLFRSNMHGPSHVYAVEIAKAP